MSKTISANKQSEGAKDCEAFLGQQSRLIISLAIQYEYVAVISGKPFVCGSDVLNAVQ